MEEEEIDVVNYDANSTVEVVPPDFRCLECSWVGRSERGLAGHKRHKHPKAETTEEPVKRARGRPRKQLENSFDAGTVVDDDLFQRVTTKQLLGGRKRPKTIVDSVDESALRTDRKASRLHDLGVIDEETSLGDYVRREVNYQILTQGIIDEGAGELVVGEEVEIENGEPNNDDEMFQNYEVKRRQQTRRYPEKLSDRIAIGDPTGKYDCYIAECDWRGGYRSLRMDHMKAVHPEWKMPSRYILERISKDGVYIDPDAYVPPFACTVEGCEWRGNYRASRSAHMRKMHPKEHADKKKNAPGYNSNGTYACHIPSCTWRGWSRSTRSQHLKRAHPDWRPEDSRSLMSLSCFHCKNSFSSYDHLCRHINGHSNHGGLGLTVQEAFDSQNNFADWLQRIEKTYSIHFERIEINNPMDEDAQQEKSYILNCNCTGERGVRLVTDARSYIYQKHGYLKRRVIQLATRTKNDCSVHLEVREEAFGNVSVKGTLEHTGHRFGTPLLRFVPTDRQLWADVMHWKAVHGSVQLMALDVVDKLTNYEGFLMENYEARQPTDLIEEYDENPLISLRTLIERSDPTCFFSVDFSEFEDGHMSFGYMTLEMQTLYKSLGPKRLVVIDSVMVQFENVEFTQYVVILHDEPAPKCALFYLTTDYRTAPAAILQQLSFLDPTSPKEIMADASEAWVDMAAKFFKVDTPACLINEWNLMDLWAAKVEQYVDNEFDIFCLVCALRRFIRVDEVILMHGYIVELFEALSECGYEQLAEFFDYQLTDPDYLRRWSPLQRDSYTSHGHPTPGVAAKTLRDLYLTNEGIVRCDQWFGHVSKRISEFNAVTMTQTVTTHEIEPQKKYYYEDAQPVESHLQEDHQGGHPEEYQDVIYDDEILNGTVVDERIIQIGEDGEEIEEVVEEIEEVNGDMDGTLEGEVIYEEIEEQEDHLEVEIQEEEYQRASNQQRPLPPKIQPHRIHMYQQKQQRERGPSTSNNMPPKRVIIQTRDQIPRRETTKSVIRSKRRKEKFSQLRDCPPEVMQALAAHAISYDGRKKEQRPYMFLPSEARMAKSITPLVATPSLKRYESRTPKQMTSHEMSMAQRRNSQYEDHSSSSQEMNTADYDHPSEPISEYGEVVEYDDEYPAESMVVRHEEVPMEHEPIDDQQPCSSASLYR